MDATKSIAIEMFYTLMCPNCKIFKRLRDEVLPQYSKKFEFTMMVHSANDRLDELK